LKDLQIAVPPHLQKYIWRMLDHAMPDGPPFFPDLLGLVSAHHERSYCTAAAAAVGSPGEAGPACNLVATMAELAFTNEQFDRRRLSKNADQFTKKAPRRSARRARRQIQLPLTGYPSVFLLVWAIVSLPALSCCGVGFMACRRKQNGPALGLEAGHSKRQPKPN
jgi:hypothetical protein